MSVLDVLKPEPPSDEIQSEEEVKKRYRYWRIRVFYSMYIGYALFYFTRKSFTFAIPALITELGFSKSHIGWLVTILAFSYAISKFVSGIISDKTNLRYFMGLGLILTGVFNILFGFSSIFVLCAVCLGLNGLFQGWGSPPCAKLLTYWYSQNERGRWWGLWNTSHNIGGALIPIICAIAIQHFGWQYAMYFPGLLAILVGLFLINRLRDNPQRVGLPPIEKFRNDYPSEKSKEKDKDVKSLTAKEILVEHVLKNKFIWILAISYFFVYIIRTAINEWMQTFLMEEKGFSLLVSGSCMFWFEIGGIFGSLTAGWMSDTMFKGKRGPVNVLFSFGVLLTLLALWFAPSGSVVLFSSMMFFIGFLIFGPQMLIGMAAAELADKEAAGTATGFAGLFAYSGAAAAGWPVGRITQDFGWTGFFMLLSICGLIAVAFLLPLWGKRARPHLAAEPSS